MKILVVGGAGYIGSHMVKQLSKKGASIVVLDDLSSGFRDAVVSSAEFVLGSTADSGLLSNLFRRHRFDAVMHFASFIQVGESMIDPAKYYANNISGSLDLLNQMRIVGVNRFIFSSTAAVYGTPLYVPIDEKHPKNPVNPYGRSKWMLEQILEDYDQAYGLKSICLRYFNAAGADPDGGIGERHQPETHLIPLLLQSALGKREAVTVFGTDYDTPDGTCIRDYVHVCDLCDAHGLALDRLLKGGESAQFNLGNGQGFSVKQVIRTACNVTGKDIPVIFGERRAGDPACLVADSKYIRDEMGWQPVRADLDLIIADAWEWSKEEFCNN